MRAAAGGLRPPQLRARQRGGPCHGAAAAPARARHARFPGGGRPRAALCAHAHPAGGEGLAQPAVAELEGEKDFPAPAAVVAAPPAAAEPLRAGKETDATAAAVDADKAPAGAAGADTAPAGAAAAAAAAAGDDRIPLPPPPEARAALASARAAALAALAAANPHLSEAALLERYNASRPRYDGPRLRGYRWAPFLRGYPVPPGYAFNYNSFMGSMDPLGGKYHVPRPQLRGFLREVWAAGRRRDVRLCLAENYHRGSYRHFQELDFDWSTPVELVLRLVPLIARIVAEEAAAAHGLEEAPEPFVSMRTPYKVHLNFPGIVTSEGRARRARKSAINRCRRELSGLPALRLLKEEVAAAEALARAEGDLAALAEEELALRALAAGQAGGGEGAAEAGAAAAGAAAAVEEGAPAAGAAAAGAAAAVEEGAAAAAAAAAPAPQAAAESGDGAGPEAGAPVCEAVDPLLRDLDWEAVLDTPHGSLRLPGCYKAPWMDKDPDWVVDKCYSVVQWRPDGQEAAADADSGGAGDADGGARPFAGSGLPAARGGAPGSWHKVPLTVELLCACSIHPTAEQMEEYEQSPAFLEDSFADMERKRQTNTRRNAVKALRKAIKALKTQLGLLPPAAEAAEAAADAGAAAAAGAGNGGGGGGAQAQRQQGRAARQPQPQPPQTLAEVAAAALEEQRRRAEERAVRDAEAEARRRRADELLRAADSRLAASAAPAAGGGLVKPGLRRPGGAPALQQPQRPRRPPTGGDGE
ncbi:hypothetical protein Rsub_04747 [Raphidocelis subcapitata]|uniref:Uncharacterized protein n=1 Tax=Raphidocelis subcapitata TaxID=307507 RepID=A0A2V0P2F5_9CHLO|nr:hypothetical protein Rsub_04747 [Raphidocelis subcapitata]|eukprot:GBF92023.1 hypothetical protein Rsub_04747 [Raphidocelis subcapitata]